MLRDRDRVLLERIDDLYISIHLTGYSVEGESCVFILYSEKPDLKIYYSIVIDCYEECETNRTLEILECLKSKLPGFRLDMLVWTHPHDDHTLGLSKIVREYCTKETKIVAPNILSTEDNYSSECNKVKNHINGLNYKQKNRWNISQTETMGSILQNIKFENGGDLINSLRIRCIAPCSDLISKKISDDDLNILSIGILIEVELKEGNVNMLFTGDMEDQTIKEVSKEQKNENIPYVYNYIKLPHHGGKSAESLVYLLDKKEKSKLGFTTIYKKTMVDGIPLNPNIEVLKKYKSYIEEIACTSDVIGDNYGIGSLKVVYDLKDKNLDIMPLGNAVLNIV